MAADSDQLQIIAINLTRRCNLACAHCYLDADALTTPSPDELTTTEVTGLLDQIALDRLKSGWCVISRGNNTESQFHVRHLVFSTPANIASALLKPMDKHLSKLLDQVAYAPIAQIHLGFDSGAFKKPLDGNGFLVPSHEKIPIRGSLWMSNLIENRAPEGKVLTSNFIGGACQAGALDNPDNVLVDQALAALQKLCGFKAAPEMVRVNRHQQGLPLYHGNYHELTRSIIRHTDQCLGLHFVANYLQGISIRDRVIQAKFVADQINVALTEKTVQSVYVWAGADEIIGRV